MTLNPFAQAIRRQPFRPFRVILTTGAAYDIRHPELIMVGRRSAGLGRPSRPDQTAYDTALQVVLLHVVGVEEIAPTTAGPNGPGI
jgi:hypothetical protein